MAIINAKIEVIAQANKQRMHVLMADPDQLPDQPLKMINRTIRFNSLSAQEKVWFNKIVDIISDTDFSDIEIDGDVNICIDAFVVKSSAIGSGKSDKKADAAQKNDLKRLINLLKKIID